MRDEISSPKPTSILSIDVGNKRIGLAGCDPLGITITPLPPVLRKNFKIDLEKIKYQCAKRSVEGLVIGLPLDKNGLATSQSKQCKKYGIRVAKALNLPLAWVNEHCSTWAAEKQYKLYGDRSGKLDSASAALLLEQWLREGPELKPVQAMSYLNHKVSFDSGI